MIFSGRGIVCERMSCGCGAGAGASRIGEGWSSWFRSLSFTRSALAGREVFRGGRTAIGGLVAGFALWTV